MPLILAGDRKVVILLGAQNQPHRRAGGKFNVVVAEEDFILGDSTSQAAPFGESDGR